MKLSLITAAALAALAGCGVSEADKKLEAPTPADTAPAEEGAPTRQLIDGKALPTSPVNLLADPGFALVGREQGYGSFLAFYADGSQQLDLTATLDSRSPAGFGGGVALVRPAKATNTKSRAVTLLTSFLGGKGPFHARVWVSKSTVDGKPADLPTDGSAVTASVMDGSPESADAFDLAVDASATRTSGGRTWVLFRGDVVKPLENGGFFVIETGTKGGHIHLAAPEITSDEVAVGQAVRARTGLTVAALRVKNTAERRAIEAYRSIPPRLTPASPRVGVAD